jgi:hypothetical protein
VRDDKGIDFPAVYIKCAWELRFFSQLDL